MGSIIKSRNKRAKEINYMMEQAKYSHRVGIVAEIKEFYMPKMQIRASHDTLKYCQQLYDRSSVMYEETFFLIALDRINKTIGIQQYIGQAGSVMVPVQKIFQFLLLINAQSFICVHNHPSGRKEPSQIDIDLTRKLKEAAKLHDMTFIDHVIVVPSVNGSNEPLHYEKYSFADEGMMF